jgi:protein-tyrosine-phosphatase
MLEAITTYINDRYGSKRGLLNHWRFGVQYRLGRFAPYANIDWAQVSNLVFICHGNICRSPLGEAVAGQRFGMRAESFGLDCRDGAPADARAIQFAKQISIDLTAHASRHIRNYRPTASDLVIVMEPKHLQQLPQPVAAQAQVTLLGLWKPRPKAYIHDPFNSDARHFDRCEKAVVNGVEGMASQWQSSRP